ncbi:MAG: hypothetical protein ACRCV4_18905, partial [Hafnia alvei]
WLFSATETLMVAPIQPPIGSLHPQVKSPLMIGSHTKDRSECDHTSDNGYTTTATPSPLRTKNKTHNNMKNIK